MINKVTDDTTNIDIVNSISNILSIDKNEVCTILQLYSVLLKDKIHNDSLSRDRITVPIYDIGILLINKHDNGHINIDILFNKNQLNELKSICNSHINPLEQYYKSYLSEVINDINIKDMKL